MSGEQEQRTEDAGDEQEEEEACVVRKLPDQTASFFLPKRKVGCGRKVDTINEKSPQSVGHFLLIIVRWVRISEEL